MRWALPRLLVCSHVRIPSWIWLACSHTLFTVDLVETGETMRAAGLEVVSSVMDTEAVLIGNPKSEHKVRR